MRLQKRAREALPALKRHTFPKNYKSLRRGTWAPCFTRGLSGFAHTWTRLEPIFSLPQGESAEIDLHRKRGVGTPLVGNTWAQSGSPWSVSW